MKIAAILIILLLVYVKASGQTIDDYPQTNQNVGFGVGLDYGGIGARIVVFTSNHIDFFGAIGYNLDGPGFNGGLSCRFTPGQRYVPYFSAMYGYNAVILVDALEEFNRTYYGPSVGFGLEMHQARRKKNYFNLEVLVPFRSSEFNDDWDFLENDPRIDVTSAAWPVVISVGYHFGL